MNNSFLHEESGYKFEFNNVISAEIGDKPTYTNLSGVDFIVETDTEYYFVEVKNVDNPKAKPKDIKKFLNKLSKDNFYLLSLKKFTDSLIKGLSSDIKYSKPIKYIYILEYKSFGSLEREKLYNEIKNNIPIGLKEKAFVNVDSILPFELTTVENFKNNYPDFKVSEVTT